MALLEAIQAGCPIVTADAGGNREVLPDRAVLVQDPSDISAYVQGIAQALQVKSRVIVPKPWDSDLVPRLWVLLGQYGQKDSFAPIKDRDATLFITDHLDTSGVARGLVNLLDALPVRVNRWLCVLHTVNGQGYLKSLRQSGVGVFSVHSTGNYIERVERILYMVGHLKVKTVCFWNVDPQVKLLLAKILAPGTLRLIDVSPDASLFYQMEHAAVFARRIAFSASDYFKRIDRFVAKYAAGAPATARLGPKKFAVIPDGVNVLSSVKPLNHILPRGADSSRVVGINCPIMPGKRIEFILDMIVELNQLVAGVTLIVIGGLDNSRLDYWPLLIENIRKRGLTNVYFAGPQTDTLPFLKLFKVYLAAAQWPGLCFNYIEALACGIPVVTVNDPKQMALQTAALLRSPALHKRISVSSRKSAAKMFSRDKMIKAYSQLLK